jgi:regulatory protein
MLNPRQYCLRLIKIRLRSVAEIEQILRHKEVEEDQIRQVVLELSEAGLLDDLRFARAWVHTQDNLSPKGEIILRQELKRRGIGDLLINQVLLERENEFVQDYPKDDLEKKKALELIKRRAYFYRDLEASVRKRRLGAYLARRGFSYELINKLYSEL